MNNKLRNVFIGLTVAVIVILASSFAFAGGDDLVNLVENDVQAGDMVGGSNTSRSLSLAASLGDVDIAQCLASTQFSVLLFAKQGVKLNEWCAAIWYDQHGLHVMAAKLRCNIPEIADEFDSESSCETANTVPVGVFTDAPIEVEPEPAEEPAADPDTGPAYASGSDSAKDDEDEDYAEAIAALRREFEDEQAARRRAARAARQKRQQEAEELGEFLDQYEQIAEQAIQVEEPPADE